MKPPLRQVRNSPRTGLVRRQNSNNVILRSTLGEGISGSAEIQSSNIRVAVRVRPFNEREKSTSSRNSVKVANDKLLVFDPKEEDDNFFYHGVKQNNRDFTKKAHKDAHFAFDAVFAPEATNEEVFEGTTKAVVDAVLEGFNCSVFAYGATGAGKTHTMLGTQQNPGIIFLTVMDLYRRMEELRGVKKFEISVSYLEVYNENVRDLLAQSNFLTIRDNGNDGITVTGLSLVKPNGAEDLLSLLKYGNSNRTQHPTDHNAESSRSHAVFQVWIKQSDRAAGLSNNFKVAKMSLIDLAGSERGCATGHTGERFREGNNINRSLLALGNCINALAEGRRHVPYRDSKLTRLLQDSLGGNCKTVMIAAVSPSSVTLEDTYNTLKYADRAKNIKSNVKKNERSVQLHVTQYEKMISELRSALASANDKIRTFEDSKVQQEPPVVLTAVESTPCPKCLEKEIPKEPDEVVIPIVDPFATFPTVALRQAREAWGALFHDRREIQHKLANLDQLEKDFQHKIMLKNQKNDRVECIGLSTLRLEKLRTKLEREINSQKPKLEIISQKKNELSKRLALSSSKENALSNEFQMVMYDLGNDELKQIIHDAMRMKQLEVALQETKDQNQYLTKTLQVQSEENTKSETLLLQLMKTAKSLYLTLRVQDSVPTYMEADFNSLVAMVEGGRGVCWADQKEETLRDENNPTFNKGVTLSPLTESNLHLDVPPSSVLCHAQSIPPISGPVAVAVPSNLDETVVIQSSGLDVTFDMNLPAAEPVPFNAKSSICTTDELSLAMPLIDLPTNVPFQSAATPNAALSSPTNKENFSIPQTGISSIPVRTPSKDPKNGILLTPNLRRGHLFSKSSSDLPKASQRTQLVSKPSYMQHTTASKFRTGTDAVFVDPAPVAAAPSGSSSRFVSSNPFK